MSLYHLIHGDTSPKLVIAKAFGITEVPRYRDLWFELIPGVSPQEALVLALYTRTGGGNREDYVDENEALTQLPGYITDEDDSFDQTYAVFRFKVTPEMLNTEDFDPSSKHEEYWNAIVANAGTKTDPGERWVAILAEMEGRAGA